MSWPDFTFLGFPVYVLPKGAEGAMLVSVLNEGTPQQAYSVATLNERGEVRINTVAATTIRQALITARGRV